MKPQAIEAKAVSVTASLSYVTVNPNVNNYLQCLIGSALPYVTIGLFPRVSNGGRRA